MSFNVLAAKAKNSWLLAFGDVMTLLITFFILMIVLNKGEITKVQKWTDDQMDRSYLELIAATEGYQNLKIQRNSLGILITIHADNSFLKGGFTPTETLKTSLQNLGKSLDNISIFKINIPMMPRELRKHIAEENLQWKTEVSVAGYTDNDPINPFSRLRNNWFLSTIRAQSVMKILYDASALEASEFSVAGYGEYRPIADNKTPEGKALNRRVEIFITANFEKMSSAQTDE